MNLSVAGFGSVASETLFVWITFWVSPCWIEERSCPIRCLFLLLPVLLIEYLCAVLCCQPKPFVGVSEGSHSSCSHLVNKGSERFQEFSLVRAGNINQAYNVAKRSLLYLLSFMRARSVAGYLFLCEADPLPGCLADLQTEGRLDCLLLIWKGRAAFCDFCRLVHLPLETSSCTTIELLTKLQLAFFFFFF